MANNSKSSKQNNTLLNTIVVLVIIAFVAAGVYATYGKIAEKVETKEIESGKKEATVSYLAEKANMSVDEYLAQYGLTLGDNIKENTAESELANNMSLENYLKYVGSQDTAEAVIASYHMEDEVTKDTPYSEFNEKLDAGTLAKRFGDEAENSIEQINEEFKNNNIDAVLTPETTYGEFQKILQENQAQLQASQQSAANAQTDGAEAQTGAETAGEGQAN